ncbi:hypothetical protein GCM10011610_19060 [Nocardia rhizosphaerihabitans]|uniref:Uncharacterized protein n=1 Tax=Nocardia rhizosphaerihabitans TaxID=1691570 RepID=A0ABQ2K9G5_9NOCA|nr:hypothetical protein GCM10011610_19060 [Nocardia rhizosphaerihabitans]
MRQIGHRELRNNSATAPHAVVTMARRVAVGVGAAPVSWRAITAFPRSSEQLSRQRAARDSGLQIFGLGRRPDIVGISLISRGLRFAARPFVTYARFRGVRARRAVAGISVTFR